jgi:transcriptional regulator with XRE-family HTH domain
MGLKEALKKARINKGYKQGDVEDLIGIKRSALSNYETGVSEPPVDKLKLLCDLYEIEPNELFEWEESHPEVDTIAAHHEGTNWTDEELEEIEMFKAFVISRRGKK